MTPPQTKREPYCDCCDLPVSSCGKAAEDEQRKLDRAHRRWLILHGWFASNYPGACDRCSIPFRPGTLIHNNGGLRWIAQCCAPDMPGDA